MTLSLSKGQKEYCAQMKVWVFLFRNTIFTDIRYVVVLSCLR